MTARLAGWRERALSQQGAGRTAMSLCLGAAMALGQAPFQLVWITLSLLPVLYALYQRCARPRSAFWLGWWTGTGYFGFGLVWIVQPFLVDAERDGWMAPFALVLMAGGLSVFWGLAFGLAHRIPTRGLAGAIVLAGCWMLADFLRSVLFTGFPWALMGYAWTGRPPAQAAAIFGPHGLSLLTLLAGLMLAHWWRGTAASAIIIAALWSFGQWRLPETAEPRADGFTVRLVQPNADQRIKWDADWVSTFYQRELDYSAADSAAQPNVVIWPETAVPFILSSSAGVMSEIASFAWPAQVILGIRELQGPPGDEQLFNSLVLLGESGEVLQRYDKHHLVPFGEYIPYAHWLAGLGIRALAAENLFGFSAGTGPALLGSDKVPPFLPLICYEAIFPDGISAPQGRPQWLLQITNDAWFGRFSGPYQHLAQAQFRAIEQGLPLARAANTGISAMIDPFGRITAQIPLGLAGYVDAPLAAPLVPTPYSRTGDLPAVLVALALVTLVPALRRV